ncbi:hypothetical protein AgCh_002708 [Apium graveolens]
MKIVGRVSVLEAETVGILEALKWLDELPEQVTTVESDSMPSVQEVNKVAGARLGCGAAAWEMRRLLGKLRRPPEARLVADFAEKGFFEWNLTILRVQVH